MCAFEGRVGHHHAVILVACCLVVHLISHDDYLQISNETSEIKIQNLPITVR